MAQIFSALRFMSGRSLQITLVISLCGGAAQAARFQNLYVVTVLPDAAAPDQRAVAEKAAFARLLVRVTGNRAAAADPLLAPLIEDARAYENSYGVDRQGRPIVGFNAARVEQALTALNLPVWGAERPLTLIWIAVDDGAGGRGMLAANELAADLPPATVELLTMVRTELAAVADERGLPIALPLLDLEDLNAVTFTDVWGGFEDRIGLASARYRADAVLIGRVRPGVLGYEFEWLLLKDAVRQPHRRHRGTRRTRRGGGSLCGRDQHRRRRDLRAAHRARRRDVRGLRPRSELSRDAERAAERRRREPRARRAELARCGARRRARDRASARARRRVEPGRRTADWSNRAAGRRGAARIPARAAAARRNELALVAERDLHRSDGAGRAARAAARRRKTIPLRWRCSSSPVCPTGSTVGSRRPSIGERGLAACSTPPPTSC